MAAFVINSRVKGVRHGNDIEPENNINPMNNEQNNIPDEVDTPFEVAIPQVEVQVSVDEVNNNIPTENLDNTTANDDTITLNRGKNILTFGSEFGNDTITIGYDGYSSGAKRYDNLIFSDFAFDENSLGLTIGENKELMV